MHSNCIFSNRLVLRLALLAGRHVNRIAARGKCQAPRCLLGASSFSSSNSTSIRSKSGAERIVLGIESSCDDTGVAVVTSSGRVLGESLATQADLHAAWGGVVPKIAQEAHAAAIDACVEDALAAAGLHPSQLDAVAVTIGPGLSLCLRVGGPAMVSTACLRSSMGHDVCPEL